MNLSLRIKEHALKAGFDLAGIAPLAAWTDLEFSRRWVERGFGGEMKYLANPKRYDPRTLLPSLQSVVCVGLVYNAPLPYSEEVRSQKPGVGRESPSLDALYSGGSGRLTNPETRTPKPESRGWISRYAWGRDYHGIMREKLEALRAEIERAAPDAETRVYVDTGPVVERAFARLSGIGWMGKNTCLINQQKGSWFFLGVVLTSLALEPDLPAPDRCGSCARCIEACPTDALEPYVMNASRCISYLNIELKGSIPEEFRAAMGNNIFGCDICQDVCPWNGGRLKSEVRSLNQEAGRRSAATTGLLDFHPLVMKVEIGKLKLENGNSELEKRESNLQDGPDSRLPISDTRSFSLFNPSLEELASITEDDFKRVFSGSPIKRAKYRGWVRNLCVAMGNSGDVRFVSRLEDLAGHADPIIRKHAEWALRRLEGLQEASNPVL